MSVHLNDGDYRKIEISSVDPSILDLIGDGEVRCYEGDRYYHLFCRSKYCEVHKSRDGDGWHSFSAYYRNVVSIQTNPLMKSGDHTMPGMVVCFQSGDCLDVTMGSWDDVVGLMRFIEAGMPGMV